MENLKEIESFLLFDLLNQLLPDGIHEDLEVDGYKIKLTKDGDKISINITSDEDESFDDSTIKSVINDYKEKIEELDDCLFVNVVEDMKKYFDIKRFDELLNQDSFNEDEASEVGNMINLSSQIICTHLQNKITELVNVYNKF